MMSNSVQFCQFILCMNIFFLSLKLKNNLLREKNKLIHKAKINFQKFHNSFAVFAKRKLIK